MFLEWDSRLETGIPEIDEKHKSIFEQLNKLMDAMNKGKGKAEVGPLIDFLGNYVETHFKEEEEAMASVVYPALSAHRSHHISFMLDFERLKSEFEKQGPTMTVLFEVQRRVADWVLNHIRNIDLKFADYAREHRINER